MTIAELEIAKKIRVTGKQKKILDELIDLGYSNLNQEPLDAIRQWMVIHNIEIDMLEGFKRGEVEKILNKEKKLTKLSAGKFAKAFGLPIDTFI